MVIGLVVSGAGLIFIGVLLNRMLLGKAISDSRGHHH